MSGEARLMLAPRIHLHAPELLLGEFANTIWKKARRKEITDAQPYLDELPSLCELMSIYPASVLIERAAQIAFAIDHPIYDCLYLACAEATDSPLITADKRLSAKVGDRLPQILVRHIGAPATIDWIKSGIAPVIKRTKVDELAASYEFFARTERSVMDAVLRGKTGLPVVNMQELKPCLDSPSYKRLVNLISDLSEQERIDVLALGWLGAGHFPDWRQSLEHAETMINACGLDYAVNYGRHWRAGYSTLTSP